MWIVFEKIMNNSQKIKIILKLQQRFRIKKYNVFTEQINKVSLSAKDD